MHFKLKKVEKRHKWAYTLDRMHGISAIVKRDHGSATKKLP